MWRGETNPTLLISLISERKIFQVPKFAVVLYAMNLLERGPLKLKFHSRTPGRAPPQYDNKIVV